MPDHDTRGAGFEPPISLSHFVQMLRAYSGVITLSLVAVVIGYTMVAVTVYLFSQSYRITSQAFRLDFEGAHRGTYPNGTKFSTAEIISTPILLKVFNENSLQRYTTEQDFVQSIFILESNPQYELLAAEYQARLADPKLTSVDRERIQKEWEFRSESLGKSDNAITYLRNKDKGKTPETIIRKTLADILTNWANVAVRERHVLSYDVSVLSPDVVAPPLTPGSDPFIAVQKLRANAIRVLMNIDQLRQLPAANLVRTQNGSASLGDVRVQIEDIVRFQLEPLIGRIHASGMSRNPQETVHLVESQLAYDERQLDAQRNKADAVRQALVAYAGAQTQVASSLTTGQSTNPGGEGETVMPQLSDSFIDRLVTMATKANDVEYRQSLIDFYREASLGIIPLEQAVVYDKTVLNLLRSAPREKSKEDTDAITADIRSAHDEIRRLTINVNEIYNLVSINLNPSTHLFTITAPPMTRVERAASVQTLVLYGVLVFFVALMLTIVLSLLHNRVNEEESADGYAEQTHPTKALG